MTLTDTPVLPSGYALHHLESATSTMDEARSLVAPNPDLAQVVWADTQTGGRGRRGRNWVSPAGNLYMTVAVRNEVPLAHAAECSFVAALALHSALIDLRPPLADKLSLKWPNDVLIGGAKVAGLLLELEAGGRWILIGCGVNVASSPDGMPYRTTSLLAEDAYVPAGQLLQSFVVELQKWRTLWLHDGFSPIRSAWLNHAKGLGAEVTANLSDRSVTGVFQDLDTDGALRLRRPDGEIMTISAGDIIFPNSADVRG
ncbi:biotin--[acetyl-CoA-carboxylase] ligase [Hwanghaeella grinnelliae]|uniref:biotin--[biotin carboxyl-carrier protein] ligase n=1 Tax=Hwanghaeella grinnelliae TaxID=2500179 RepID=A0A3S2WCI3_9PROT|nr:biotin--[acetyl-CoA-carboxylase] ligase [Hwanghaeella grinnelliae]RVU39303.1 biotin--[acetyl-CoA-carboxylase] ligase [Hwanghaeella grinnelliae]